MKAKIAICCLIMVVAAPKPSFALFYHALALRAKQEAEQRRRTEHARNEARAAENELSLVNEELRIQKDQLKKVEEEYAGFVKNDNAAKAQFRERIFLLSAKLFTLNSTSDEMVKSNQELLRNSSEITEQVRRIEVALAEILALLDRPASLNEEDRALLRVLQIAFERSMKTNAELQKHFDHSLNLIGQSGRNTEKEFEQSFRRFQVSLAGHKMRTQTGDLSQRLTRLAAELTQTRSEISSMIIEAQDLTKGLGQ